MSFLATVAFGSPDIANGAISFGDTEFGWMDGFSSNWSAKIEYNFMNFDLDDHRFTLGELNSRFDNDLDVHGVKAGINDRFAPYAAPVTARH